MDELKAALIDKHASGLYILESEASISDIASLTEQFGFRFIYVNGLGISKGGEFLNAAAKALNGFPMADNWNALLDYLRDLSWLPADKGYVFLYDNIHIFAQQDRYFFDITIDTLRDATESWNTGMENSKFMYILLRGSPQMLATLKGIPELSQSRNVPAD